MSKDLLPYLPLVVVLILMVRRTGRPRVVQPSRLWIFPAIFLTLALFYAWGAYRQGPHLSMVDDLIILGGAVGGIALGFARAHTVKLDRHPDTGHIQSTLTIWGVGFLVVWMLGRSLLRQAGFAGASEPFGVFTDTMFALAFASVCARAFVLSRRCRELMNTSPLAGEVVRPHG
jgi:hypothetical protein